MPTSLLRYLRSLLLKFHSFQADSVKNKLAPWRKRASSLVTTLLVITILTVIVIAFLQSMTIEKRTAVSYSNLAKARLAAEAGTEEAMAIVRKLFLDYPDSATAWVTNMAPTNSTNQTPGTAFYYYDSVSVTNTNASGGPLLYFRPLISGATNVLATNRATALAGVADLTNWININSSNLMGGSAWVGRPPGTTTDPRIDLPWVNVMDGTKVVARYAYWIEDESFRVNLNVATNVLRGAASIGTNASEIPIQGTLRSTVPSDTSRDSVASNIVSLRGKLPFDKDLRSLRNINYADSSYTNLSDSLGFITTIYSGGLNISRTGARRVNLNAIVLTNSIQDQVNKIIATFTNQAPTFGQRFYRTALTATNTPGVTNSLIYVQKIAANIRDYIDSDSVPTILGTNGVVLAAAPNGRALGRLAQENPAGAIGKENVPRLQEASIHVWQSNMAGQNQTSPYDIRIAYYLEFWNMGVRDIVIGNDNNPNTDDLPSDSYLGIANQMEWKRQDGTYKIEDPPDIMIPLSDFENGAGTGLVFKAGELTVLATTRTFPPAGIIPTGMFSKIYRPKVSWAGALNVAPFRYTGTVEASPTAGSYQNLATLVCDGRDGTSSPSNPGSIGNADANWDASTEVMLGTPNNWLESQLGSVVVRPGIFIDSFSAGGNQKASNPNMIHWRGGSQIGNKSDSGVFSFIFSGGNYQVGDPRANNEQLRFTSGSTLAEYQTAFNRWRGTQKHQSAYDYTDYAVTIGDPNTRYMQPNGGRVWDEGNSAQTTNSLASGGSPAYYQNGTMQSIAELGHIYDPMRGALTANFDYASGGARTLNIGRSERIAGTGSAFAFWDGDPTSASRRWTAWRLLDFFSTTDNVQTKGLINPNGALRDNGQAVQAMLEGFAFSASNQATDSTLNNKSLSTNAIAAFGASLTSYLSNSTNLPFFERGQLSELGFFNTNSLPNLSGVNFGAMNDRGAEELFRRMAEMVTTKGNTFTIYAIGQTVQTLPGGKIKPVATVTRKVTFGLQPKFKLEDPAFTDTNYAFVTNRLASPTNYVINILSQSE